MWDSWNSFIDSAAENLPDTSELLANTSEIITNVSTNLNTFVSESTGGQINLENIENAVENKIQQATQFVSNVVEDLGLENKPQNAKIKQQLKQKEDGKKHFVFFFSYVCPNKYVFHHLL